MEQAFGIVTLWFGLALIATFLTSPLKRSGALAVTPTLIANAGFLPRHLMPARESVVQTAPIAASSADGSGVSDEPLEEG